MTFLVLTISNRIRLSSIKRNLVELPRLVVDTYLEDADYADYADCDKPLLKKKKL